MQCLASMGSIGADNVGKHIDWKERKDANKGNRGDEMQKEHRRTEWLLNKMFTNRGWELTVKNGRHVLCKRF